MSGKGSAATSEGRSERAYIAAAHRDGRSEDAKHESLEKAAEIHEHRTGEPLKEEGHQVRHRQAGAPAPSNDKKHSVDQPGLADTAEGRSERAFIAAAHRDGRDEEGKKESLEKASRLHEERTGEPLAEAVESEGSHERKRTAKDTNKAPSSSHTSEHRSADASKTNKVEQPGLAETEEGRKERAFIAAAHREGRSEEGKKESLLKASELHEERTGSPLPEAVEEGIVDSPAKEEHHTKQNLRGSTAISHTDANASHHVEQPGLASTAAGRSERAYIANAHREDRTEESRNEALIKASELHEMRTGEPLPEAVEMELVEDTERKNLEHKRKHAEDSRDNDEDSEKKQKTIDISTLTPEEIHEHNREIAFISAAHRRGRTEEGKEESLLKASELHEKLTGEPLQEAVQKGLVDVPDQ